jgi:glycerate kinase
MTAAGVPHIVIAPDKFKGTLTAAQAGAAMRAGALAVAPDARITLIPVADGGEGTIDALLVAGAVDHVVTVSGPLDQPTQAHFALRDGVVFIEAAQACGLQLIEPSAQSALHAHSKGLGELIDAALDAGAQRIVVGLGGVACTDGGAGMAEVLGVRLVDPTGQPIPPGGEGLASLAAIDLAGLDPRLRRTTVVAATDVRNPLIGADGAARIYGPQKGAGPSEVALLERALAQFAHVLQAATGKSIDGIPGSGAAGGIAAGMVGIFDAPIASGCDLVLDLLQVAACIADADLVLTGEGKLDAQSLFGKAPVGVAMLARRYSVPAIAIAGAIDRAEDPAFDNVFDASWSLTEQVGPLSMNAPADALTAVTAQAVRQWLHD